MFLFNLSFSKFEATKNRNIEINEEEDIQRLIFKLNKSGTN